MSTSTLDVIYTATSMVPIMIFTFGVFMLGVIGIFIRGARKAI